MNINFWSSPRNVSTALMYSFAQHPQVTVADEPLYAHYLLRTESPTPHPGREEILASQTTDRRRLVNELLRTEAGKTRVFKQMTHHLIELDWSFLTEMKNVLLIRDPHRIVASYSKVTDAVTVADIGYELQGKLHDHLVEHNALQAVVDAKRLLLDPPGVLRALCTRLGLDFDERMLNWEAGARPEDGIWAKYWYANVHKSTSFTPYEERTVELTPEQQAVVEQCLPTYERLLNSPHTL